MVLAAHLHHGGLAHLCHRDAAQFAQHERHGIALGNERRALLLHHQALGANGVVVALGHHTTRIERRQFFLTRGEQRLVVGVQLELLVEEQQREVHLVHAAAHSVEVDLGLRRLHISALTRHGGLTRNHAAVPHVLVHIQPYAILVFLQPRDFHSALAHHLTHLVGPRRDVALQGCLSGERHLRQPALAQVLDRVIGGARYQVALLDERIIGLRGLLARGERGLRHGGDCDKAHEQQYHLFCHRHDCLVFSIAKFSKIYHIPIILSP